MLKTLEKQQTEESFTYTSDYKEMEFKNGFNKFMYYDGVFVAMAVIFLVAAFFLCRGISRKDNPDITVMVLSSQPGVKKHIDKLKLVMQESIEDADGKSDVVVEFLYIPVSQGGKEAQMATQTRLLSEISAGRNMLYISDSISDKNMESVGMFNDFKVYYPISGNGDVNKFRLCNSKLKTYLKWNDMPEDLYISILPKREGMVLTASDYDHKYDNAKKALKDFIYYINK